MQNSEVRAGGGRNDNQTNLLRGHARHRQRLLCGFKAHRSNCFMRCGNTTLTDTCAGDNPLVRGFYHFFQVGVCTHLLGQIAAGTNNLRIHVRSVTLG